MQEHRVPNIQLREEDEELFEMNYIEYSRKDIEGSDSDTRWRMACELLKGIALNYKEQVMAQVSVQIQRMLALYAANPAENWKAKDSAIYLVVALTPKAGTRGVATGYLVDVEGFFTSVIVPQLQRQDVNATPILKADAHKFFTVFREQIPKPAAIALLLDVMRFLGSELNVVHSYAANCIGKLLMAKDRALALAPGLNAVNLVPRYGASDINPIVQQLMRKLMRKLLGALQFPQENPYIMKCIMRVLGIVYVTGELVQACINHLASVLAEVCKNPENPTFNHYLFEAIAALVGHSCKKDQSLIGGFEGCLFQVLENILVDDISEFWACAFQIFARFVEIRKPPLSDSYMQLFQVLLTPETWKKSANVLALVRLLQAYLQKAPNELNNKGRLSQVLGIFNKLISASNTEELGFFVLNTVVDDLGYDMIAPYISGIWNALFMRLQNKRPVKFVNSLVIFMSLVLVKHGPGILVDSINAVQANIFGVILQQFLVPNLRLILGATEVKLTAVAATRLICKSPSLLDASATELWGKILDSIITLLGQPDDGKRDLENDTPDVHETMGYSTAFARLHYAGKKEEDRLKEIRDPKEFLVTSIAKLSALAPGRYPAIIEKYVGPSSQATLLQVCGTYNCAIV